MNKTPDQVRESLNRLEAGLERPSAVPVPDPLTTKRGLSVVGRYAFDNENVPLNTRRIAARCLNNIIVLAQPMRQVFVDEGYPQKVVARLKNGEPDDELACGNLLLFSSVQTTLDLSPSFENDGLAELINNNLARHAKSESPLTDDPAQPCVASLKLMSTLAVSYEAQAHLFIPSVQSVFDLLDKVTIPTPPMQLPVSLLVGCLASVPFHDKSRKGVSFPKANVGKLIDVVDASLRSYAGKAGEMNLLTPMVALHRVAQAADLESDTIKQLKERLLPSEEDRKEVLGRGQTLPHRLLRFGVNSTSPELRDPTLSLLFELSNKDPREFIRNVGFGNAIGYLTTKGINVSQEDMAAGGGDVTDTRPINPITGQRMDMEAEVDLPEMTDEEKEREAERLFVLFERLRATGVVNVENPAARAASMPSVEEVESSDDEKK
ncbi:hypothetical protein SAPIO_CDS2866 [Scedosporium apiospermum]|uniref:Guanine nucleotide exchange factor synembryn n=1 Tax=Pseudallescheria apiosperma TaxID=563466 RepID=A0A084GBQ4_PSEDA|nr:uncharacterized protein SAPIO_CDS2866 [Scedosporium apiospermum]KEZ44766.1 hypothetical protein SAPIO_CDS2866 [Scedosporium apiospermum]